MNVPRLLIVCLPLLGPIVILCVYIHSSTEGERKLSDIDFMSSPTEKQVETIWGLPDARAGRDKAIHVYRAGKQEVLMAFESSPPHRLAWIRMMPASDITARPVGTRELSSLKFTNNITYEQVASVWGWPDYFGGSGIDYFVYQLNDEQEVWIEFASEPPNRVERAILKNTKTGQIRSLL